MAENSYAQYMLRNAGKFNSLIDKLAFYLKDDFGYKLSGWIIMNDDDWDFEAAAILEFIDEVRKADKPKKVRTKKNGRKQSKRKL
jgi:hypothetical protein